MQIKTGCDLVNIARFRQAARRGGAAFLDRVFSPVELSGNVSTESLAGVFAAKEAVVKALGLPADSWHKIEIIKNKEGRPEIKMLERTGRIVSQDLSVSHDGDYVLAVTTFLCS